MVVEKVFIFCAFFLGYALFNETSSRLDGCYPEHPPDQSMLLLHDKDQCNRGVKPCLAQTSDHASKIVRDLYYKIKKMEKTLADPNQYPPDYRPQEGEEFDFIVVGAGSAGSVIANRLTEVFSWKVLLVEAGGNPPKSSEVPGLATSLQLTDIDWQYKTDSEENNCLGMVNNSCNWPRGKVLGGSSTTNFMMYVRGNARDYDNWGTAGHFGWSYEDVLPYFKKSEDLRSPEKVWYIDDSDKYHGKGGYLKVEPWSSSDTDSLMEVFGKGMEDLGYVFNPDYNGKNQTGFIRFYGTLDNRKRCSTAKAFLSPIKDRRNLKVAKNTLVTKVLINQKTSTAFGVELKLNNGKVINIFSKKEVIVSAGAINSPQILMLSGIGLKKHLEGFKIPTVKNLPVGMNLQDHPLMMGLVITVNHTVPTPQPIESMFEFLTKGTGRFTNMGASTYSSFINTMGVNEYPDMQFLHVHVHRNDSATVKAFLNYFGMRDSVTNEYIKINKEGDTVFLLGSLLRPFSRGQILLKSADSEVHPKIIAGTFTDSKDTETFLRTYDFVQQLVQTEALKGVDAKLHEVQLPSCEKHHFPSREYRECSLRHLTTTTYHYSGTCKMGPSSDPGAVVDNALNVYGVKGLRVADASVMPTIVSGNINAAVIMIGEKASDLIKEDWL